MYDYKYIHYHSRGLLCLSMLHLFVQTYSKNTNTVKYYYNLKWLFPFLIFFFTFNLFLWCKAEFTLTFMHLADAFIQSDLQAIISYIFTYFFSMCVPWESNPQPFALLTQCSTTEPQEQHDFTASLLLSSVSHDPSEIILIYWLAAQ